MNPNKKLFKNFILYAISSAISGLITFVMMPIYTRVLTPEEYGMYSMVIAISAVLVIPCLFGLENAILKFHFSLDDNNRKDFNGTIIIFISFLSILGFGLYFLLRKQINQLMAPELPLYPFIIFGIIITILKPIYTIYLTILQVRQKAGTYLLSSVLFLTINILFNLIFLFVAKKKSSALLLGMLCASAIIFCISYIELFGKKYANFTFNKRYLKLGVKYSFPLILGPLLIALSAFLVRYFINKFLSLSSVAIYDIAMQFAIIIGVVQLAINRALFPFAYNEFKNNRHEKVAKITELLIMFYMFICSGMAIFAKEIIVIFSGPKFHEAAILLPFFALAYLIKSLNYHYDNNILYSFKGPKYLLISNILSILLLILMTYFLLPVIGILATGVSLVVSNLFSTCLSYFFARKVNYVNYNENKLIMFFIFVLILSSIGIFVIPNQRYSINIISRVLIYILISCTIIVNQRKFIKEFFKQFKQYFNFNKNKIDT